MNIIIVAKPFSTPKVLRLADWRSAAPFVAAIGGVFSIAVLCGAIVGARHIGPSAVRDELVLAREELTAQRAEVERLNDTVERDMNALALRIGKLQAEAMRLNALGDRLAEVGQLADGEFDFREEPAMGGPEVGAEHVEEAGRMCHPEGRGLAVEPERDDHDATLPRQRSSNRRASTPEA